MDTGPSSPIGSETNLGYPTLNLATDPRVQWLKKRVLAYIGMNDEELFYSMMESPEAKEKLTTFLSVPLKPNEQSLDKRTFYFTKIIVDKLIHEDIEFTEWSKFRININ